MPDRQIHGQGDRDQAHHIIQPTEHNGERHLVWKVQVREREEELHVGT